MRAPRVVRSSDIARCPVKSLSAGHYIGFDEGCACTAEPLARFVGRENVVELRANGDLVRVEPDRKDLSTFSARWLSRPDEMIRIALETLGPDYTREGDE